MRRRIAIALISSIALSVGYLLLRITTAPIPPKGRVLAYALGREVKVRNGLDVLMYRGDGHGYALAAADPSLRSLAKTKQLAYWAHRPLVSWLGSPIAAG